MKLILSPILLVKTNYGYVYIAVSANCPIRMVILILALYQNSFFYVYKIYGYNDPMLHLKVLISRILFQKSTLNNLNAFLYNNIAHSINQ